MTTMVAGGAVDVDTRYPPARSGLTGPIPGECPLIHTGSKWSSTTNLPMIA
jgi:hypothetical protein